MMHLPLYCYDSHDARSDFYDSNLRNRRLRFCQPPVRPRHVTSKPTMPRMLDAEVVFGTASPIIPVIHALRHVSLSLEPNHSDMDRAMASLSIYDIEYDLNQLNGESSDIECLDGAFEVAPLKTAAHIYLYLMIRQIPRGSPAFNPLSRRLRVALEEQDEQWWCSNKDREYWLLWMLFIGYVATSEVVSKQWFLQNALGVCKSQEVTTRDDLLDILRSVMWNGSRGREEVDLFWRESGLQ